MPDKKNRRISGGLEVFEGTSRFLNWWSQGESVFQDNVLFSLGIFLYFFDHPHMFPTSSAWNTRDFVHQAGTIARGRRRD